MMTIRNFKQKMVDKAIKAGGIWENFGQSELDKLKDRYRYGDLVYGTEPQRQTARDIDSLGEWAETFTGRGN